jgi:N-hydroxyarylamine O-acetyltransferase
MTTRAAIDLDAYFRRIGYEGERAPTLGVLRAVHLHHAQSIPFENLDPLLGRPVRLDPAGLERKLVHDRRGGYCFEHNLLLRHALEGLGFGVAGLAARVLWNRPEGTVPACTHMLLRIDLEGERYMADVGFGGQTLTAPLRLVPGLVQQTPHEPHRLIPAGDDLVLETLVRGEWRPVYRFGLCERYQADYEVASWYLSHHPESPFVNGLMAALPAPGRRYALRDNVMAVHPADGETEKRVLRTADALRTALEGPIGLRLPAGEEVDAVLERLAARPA